jgi:hypothetical protein
LFSACALAFGLDSLGVKAHTMIYYLSSTFAQKHPSREEEEEEESASSSSAP